MAPHSFCSHYIHETVTSIYQIPNHTVKAADLRKAVLFCITSYFSYRDRQTERDRVERNRDRKRKEAYREDKRAIYIQNHKVV